MALTVAELSAFFEADVSSLDRTLASLKAKLAGITKGGVDVAVNVQDKAAIVELDKVSRDRTTDVEADADTAKAEAELDRLARTRDAKVRVNVDDRHAKTILGRLSQALGGRGTTGLLGLGLAGAPLLGPLAGPLAGAAGGIAGAGAAGLGGAGILGVAVAGQIAAMKKARQAIDSDAKSLAGMEKGTDSYKRKLAALNAEQTNFNKTYGVAAKALGVFNQAWAGFLRASSGTTNSLIAQTLTGVAGILPKLLPIVKTVGAAVGKDLGKVFDLIGGPIGQRFLDFIGRMAPKVLRQFTTIGVQGMSGLMSILEALGPLGVKMFRGLAKAVSGFAGWASQLSSSSGFKAFLGYVRDNAPKLLSVLGSLAKIVGRVVVALAPFGAQLLTGIAKLFSLVSKAPTPVLLALAAGIAALVSPIAGAVLGVAALVTVFEHLFQTDKKFRGFVNGIGQAFAPLLPQIQGLLGPAKDLFTSFVSMVEAIWAKFGGDLERFAVTYLSGVITVIKGALNIVAGIFKLIRDVLTGNWSGAWKDIEQIVKGALGIIVGLVKMIWAGVRLEFTVAIKILKTLWSGLWGGLKQLAKAGWDAVGHLFSVGISAAIGFVKSIPGRVKSALASLSGLLRSIFTGAMSAGLSVVTGIGGRILSWISGIPGKIGALAGRMKTAGAGIIHSLIEGIKSAAGYLGGIAGSIWDKLKMLINGAIDWLNQHLQFHVDPPGPIPGFTIKPPVQIPHLARGAVVRRPTRALIGEAGPEAVVPLSKGKGALTGLIDYEQLGAVLARHLGGGRGPLIGTVVQAPDESTDQLAERLWFKTRRGF